MKRVIKISAVIIAAVLLLLQPCAAAHISDSDGNISALKFNSDGKFTILQISDPQDDGTPRSALLEAMERSYDIVEPDLVVFTGDMVLGKIEKGKSIEVKYAAVKAAIDAYIKPIEERGIPFAVVFGNHDDQCGVTKAQQVEMYRSYKGCIGFNLTDETLDYGTYNIPILDSAGEKTAYNLWMVDSAGNGRDGKYYEYVSENTIGWYTQTSELLKRANGGEPVYSLMFQHIPVPEIYELLNEASADTDGAVEKNGKYYTLNTGLANGYLGEGPCPCEENFGEFDAIVAGGDVSAIIFGHDHVNSFVGTLRGVDIVQTPGISLLSYGDSKARGVRVFEIDENNPKSYSTHTLSYFDLMPGGISSRIKLLFQADEFIPAKIAVIAVPCLAAVVILAVLGIKKLRKKKHS
ncbi:MAG: hypothetical protein GX051_09690 [Clostridiales bacterium]|nr:hypothetical protein [Clostridiales bacterium]